MNKDNIQESLVATGRKLIKEKGVECLTVRKLSEASGCSVGTIYNQFGNMDNFVLIQNYMTLDELYRLLSEIKEPSAYQRLNAYVQKFAEYVLQNKNFWFMLFNFHLNNVERSFSLTYLKRVSTMISLLETSFKELYPKMKTTKRQVGVHVLWITLFALSALLTTSSLETYSKIEQTKICKFLLNTYLTGFKIVEKI